MWEYSVCDNCGSKKNKVFLNNITTWEYSEKFRIVECETCSLKYINPRPKKNSFHKFYSEKGYWGRDLQQVKTSFKKFKSVREKSYKNIYRNILRFKSKGNIFDVGAGLGLFLSKFKDLDWKVDGVELNPKAVKFAKRNFSINLGNADFDGIKL